MVKQRLINIIKYILFLGSGILIFYFVYKGQNPSEIISGIREFKIEWILLSYGFSLLSHIVRALRWRMMILPLGYSPGRLNSFLAILVMYLANFAFPRLGEVSRCGVLTKYEKVPFAPQIGTVVSERIIDLIMLIILFLVLILAQFELVASFVESTRLKVGFDSTLIQSGLFWAALIASFLILGLLIYFFRKEIGGSKWAGKTRSLLKKFTEGLLSVRNIKQPGLFIFYSIAIYAGYFLMTYSIFLGFGPSRELGAMAAFAILVSGSIGMVIPVQGGIGTYHFFVIQTLLLFGLTRPDGQLLALVLHGSTTIFMIFIGLIALVALPLVNRKSSR